MKDKTKREARRNYTLEESHDQIMNDEGSEHSLQCARAWGSLWVTSHSLPPTCVHARETTGFCIHPYLQHNRQFAATLSEWGTTVWCVILNIIEPKLQQFRQTLWNSSWKATVAHKKWCIFRSERLIDAIGVLNYWVRFRFSFLDELVRMIWRNTLCARECKNVPLI